MAGMAVWTSGKTIPISVDIKAKAVNDDPIGAFCQPNLMAR
jgi:hypothetical protein